MALDVPDAAQKLQVVADLLAFEQLISTSFEIAVQIKGKEKPGLPKITEKNVKSFATTLTEEYLASDNVRDVAKTVDELKAPDDMLAQLIKNMILSTMDKSEKERIMVSGLLSSLCVRGALEPSNVEAGLELVLKRLEDLVIDVPKAIEYTSNLMAHLIEDKTVPESILDSVDSLAGSSIGPQLVSGVKSLLTLPLQVTELKAKARSAIQEYFISGEISEAMKRLEDLHAGRFGHVVVKLLLVAATEKKNREREMASVLLSALTKLYGSEHFFEGFIRVLRNVDDLALDTPSIVSVMTNFIARAIVDDVLPPCFLSLVPPKIVMHGRGKEISAGVRALLEQHGSNRIMNVWGSGAKQTMEELRDSIKLLIDEYFVSGDATEAVRCVQELDAPHYGHQVIKNMVYKAVEVDNEHCDEAVRKVILLIKALLSNDAFDHLQVDCFCRMRFFCTNT